VVEETKNVEVWQSEDSSEFKTTTTTTTKTTTSKTIVSEESVVVEDGDSFAVEECEVKAGETQEQVDAEIEAGYKVSSPTNETEIEVVQETTTVDDFWGAAAE